MNRKNIDTFSGVFCPVVLSQLGTLLFLRLGFAVGQAGILESSFQLLLAYFFLFLTILSICAICTNGAIEQGGIYFMISRTLGPEFGGSLGILFFTANIFASCLHVTGFTEGLIDNFGPSGHYGHFLSDHPWMKFLYSFLLLSVCILLCLFGSSRLVRISVLGIILLCFGSTLCSLLFQLPQSVAIPKSNLLIYHDKPDNTTVYFNFTGPRARTLRRNLFNHYSPDYKSSNTQNLNFSRVFAILFSTVTGIMNGANLYCELEKPKRSIPLGTLLATGFTLSVYLLFTVVIGSSCQHELLANNYNYLIGISLWQPIVIIGTFTASFYPSMSNLVGSSRILEALAKDNLFGMLLKPAKLTLPGGHAVPTVIISYCLVLFILLVNKNMNTLAPFVSTFYLLSYASTNMACAALDLAATPNFRPSFKVFHWFTCLLGMIGCLVMSFIVSYVYTPISIMLLFAFIIFLHLRDLPDTWGSITQALIFHQVRKYLLKLDPRKAVAEYWRPQILLLVANPRSNSNLIEFVNDLKKGGLYVLGHVVKDRFDNWSDDLTLQESKEWLTVVDYLKVKAFVELTVAPSVREGMHHLIRVSGLGGMKPNTVCLGFYDDANPVDTLFCKMLSSKLNSYHQSFHSSRSLAHVQIQLPPVRKASDLKKVEDMKEYMKMLMDVLKLKKNLLVCRNFQHYTTKASLAYRLLRGKRHFIDVWPVNFLKSQFTGIINESAFIALHLASNLRAKHYYSRVRLFLCVDTFSDMSKVSAQLDLALFNLGISVEVRFVHLDIESSTPMSSVSPSETYLHKVNRVLVSHSGASLATFINLPKPAYSEDDRFVMNYLSSLGILSMNLPPTFFVRCGQKNIL